PIPGFRRHPKRYWSDSSPCTAELQWGAAGRHHAEVNNHILTRRAQPPYDPRPAADLQRRSSLNRGGGAEHLQMVDSLMFMGLFYCFFQPNPFKINPLSLHDALPISYTGVSAAPEALLVGFQPLHR